MYFKLFFVMAKLNFQRYYSSLQCHMILLICCSRNRFKDSLKLKSFVTLEMSLM